MFSSSVSIITFVLVSQALALVPGAPPPPLANCFSGGQPNHNQDWAKTQVKDVCKDFLASKYTKDQERHHCFDDGPNSWMMSVTFTGDDEKALSLGKCVGKLKLIIASCIPYGGKEGWEGFEFTADPNNGHCSDGINDDSPPVSTTPPSANNVVPDERSCSEDNIKSIQKEFDYAFKMAKKAESVTGSSDYFQALLTPGSTSPPNFELEVQSKYKRYPELLTNQDRYKSFKIQCRTTVGCGDFPDGKWAYAYTVDKDKVGDRVIVPFMNLCPVYFNLDYITPTETILEQCQPGHPKSGDWDQLYKFRTAGGKYKTFVPFHEMSHTWLVNDKNVRAEDYAYGLLDAIALKKGTLQHGVKDICKDEPDQICPPEKSLENPDSLAFVAAGEYFSEACGRAIGLDLPPASEQEAIDDQLPDPSPEDYASLLEYDTGDERKRSLHIRPNSRRR